MSIDSLIYVMKRISDRTEIKKTSSQWEITP